MGVFIENKYYRWYIALTEKAKGRVLGEDVYTEVHHVLPRSLGGSNDLDNFVNLTAREHFLAHLMLVKCLEGQDKAKMVYALIMMIGKKEKNPKRNKDLIFHVNSRIYEKLKRICAELLSQKMLGKPKSLEHRTKIGNSHRGKIVSEETKEKLRHYKGPLSSMWGRKWSKEERSKWKIKKGKDHPYYGTHHSEEWKQNVSNKLKGRVFSEEHKRKIGQANKGKIISPETRKKLSEISKKQWSNKDLLESQREKRCKYKYEVTYPDGTTIVIHNLRQFIRQNSFLNFAAMQKVTKGKQRHHKGFKIKIIGEIEHD